MSDSISGPSPDAVIPSHKMPDAPIRLQHQIIEAAINDVYFGIMGRTGFGLHTGPLSPVVKTCRAIHEPGKVSPIVYNEVDISVARILNEWDTTSADQTNT